jgi:hypothetical protein
MVTARELTQRKKCTNPLLGGVCLVTTGGLLCGRTCQVLFIIFPAACTESPCGRSNGIVSLALGWWLRDPWSSLAPNDLLSVLTALKPGQHILSTSAELRLYRIWCGGILQIWWGW